MAAAMSRPTGTRQKPPNKNGHETEAQELQAHPNPQQLQKHA